MRKLLSVLTALSMLWGCAGANDAGPIQAKARRPLFPLPGTMGEEEKPADIQKPLWEEPPAPAHATGSRARLIQSRADVPLKGLRVDAKSGDWMLESDGNVAVVSWEGRVIDLGPKNGPDGLVYVIPGISLVVSEKETEQAKISAIGEGGRVLRVERAVPTKPMLLVSHIYFSGSILKIDSVAVNTGGDPALAAVLGERASFGNVPVWFEGAGYVTRAGAFIGDFLGGEAFGRAYALCSEEGRVMSQFGAIDVPGFYSNGRDGETMVLVPERSYSAGRRIAISYSDISLGDAVSSLPCGYKSASRQKLELPQIPVRGARAEIVRCGSGNSPGLPFSEFSAESKIKNEVTLKPIELPTGCFLARYRAPGHSTGMWVNINEFVSARPAAALRSEHWPKAGLFSWEVSENEKPVPARILVKGVKGTPDPDWGDLATDGAALNVIHSELGKGERPIPPGKYKVSVTRGFEYSAIEKEIEVSLKKPASLKASLQRIVNTKGWISADLHLHAQPSPDAPAMLEDRVRSLLSAGVEVGVATDHNMVSDYGPAILALGMKGQVASIVGDEVTTKDLLWGHFNVFPLEADSEPLAYRNTLPSRIFAEARSRKPLGKGTIVQVNHPRMGDIGYFDILRMDGADIAGWKQRTPLADMSFDAIEIFNGDHYDKIDKVEQCMRDWYALLSAGFKVTATGNSDSHRLTFHEPGTPRNYVSVGNDNPAEWNVDREKAFVDALRAGKVIVSSGPFVDLKVGEKGIGDTVSPGEFEVLVSVDAPSWVDLSRVELVVRGQAVKAWDAKEISKAKRPMGLKTKLSLKAGDWVIAIARGQKPMEFLYRSGALPFAFTNAVYVK